MSRAASVEPRTGDVFVFPLPGGGYGAGQVATRSADQIATYALDWYSADPPTLDRLAAVPPLRLTHHAHDGLGYVWVDPDNPVPPGFRWLGNQSVRPEVPAECPSFADWSYLPIQVAAQRRWDRDLPEAARAAYRAAATRGQVEVDLGAGPVALGAAWGRLDLARSAPVPVPTSGPVRWSGLDALPRCTWLSWTGPDRGLSAALAARPMISSLAWHDPPDEVDLSAAIGLEHLHLGGAPRLLRLPPNLRSCRLAAASAAASAAMPVEVTAPADGRWLALDLAVSQPGYPVPAGLRAVREVALDGPGAISVAGLAALPDLQVLRVRWCRPPGRLDHAEVLAQLADLRQLWLVDGYGLTADTLPDLPALTHLTVDGLPRSVATGLRSRYRRSPVRLTVRGAKSDSWLRANVSNPLRDWVDDDERGGAAACRAYAATVRELARLPVEPDRRQAAERVLHTLVDKLNRIDQRYQLIDTLRREEAGAAFAKLATSVGVPEEVADDWFDGWRDF